MKGSTKRTRCRACGQEHPPRNVANPPRGEAAAREQQSRQEPCVALARFGHTFARSSWHRSLFQGRSLAKTQLLSKRTSEASILYSNSDSQGTLACSGSSQQLSSSEKTARSCSAAQQPRVCFPQRRKRDRRCNAS